MMLGVFGIGDVRGIVEMLFGMFGHNRLLLRALGKSPLLLRFSN